MLPLIEQPRAGIVADELGAMDRDGGVTRLAVGIAGDASAHVMSRRRGQACRGAVGRARRRWVRVGRLREGVGGTQRQDNKEEQSVHRNRARSVQCVVDLGCNCYSALWTVVSAFIRE